MSLDSISISLTSLTETELEALLTAPDRATWTGRRDHTLFALAAQTGLRVSELIGLRCADIHLGVGAHVSCQRYTVYATPRRCDCCTLGLTLR